MTSSHVTSNRDSLAAAAEVKTRRAPAAGADHETYGAEDLPVLIRLPDLTKTAPRAVATLRRTPDAGTRAAASVAVDAPTGSSPVACSSGPAMTASDSVAADSLAGRRQRRGALPVAKASPTGGARQYLTAFLLAVALFAIIVTIKESRHATPAAKPTVGGEQVAAPAIRADRTDSTPPVDLHPPVLAPPANAVTEALEGPVETAFETGAPVAPDAAGYADGAVQVTESESYGSYPSTAIEPVQAQPAAARSAADSVWSPPMDRNPQRSAGREPTDNRYEQR
jgi:hypothetical protein